MKTFEDLLKFEKEKVSVYLQYVNFLQITTMMTLLVGLSIFLVGYALLFIFVIPIVMLIGVFAACAGISLVLLAMLSLLLDKKYLFLVFGYKNLYSDIFNIKKEDIKKVKIIREVKWIKEK